MELDFNLYSRQIGAYGLETMEQLIQKRIYIYGIGGLGLEIAKNIILAGPKQVTINDNNIVQTRDLGSNYFIKENNVGKNTRSEASLFKLRELNAYVQVEIDKRNLIPERNSNSTGGGGTRISVNSSLSFLKEYDVLVITEFISKEASETLNNFCRENKIGFIYSCINGLAGFVFVDFGDLFLIHDDNGEETKQFYVRNITKENPGIVFIDDSVDNQKLDLSHGDYVTFKEITGMTELNDTPPRPVRILSPFTFSIEDTSKFSDYICGGIIEQIKVPKPVFNRSVKEAYENIYQDEFGMNGKNCANNSNVEMLHLAYLALNEFYTKYERFPEVNDFTDADRMLEISKIIYSLSKDKKRDWAISLNENLNELYIIYLSIWSRLNPAPICSYLGGIVAQEIIKITGKFTPFNQWYYCDFFYLLKNDHKKNVKKPLKEDYENRYFDQICIFGREIQDIFRDLNIFIIGCGALGTEFLKIFSLLGISSGRGNITITDSDIIEISNLNRQLLFRRENVGGFKCKIAKDMIKQINSDVNCIDKQIKIDESSEELLDDEFYKKQDIIFTCVDNIDTRRYVDRKITLLKKIHIDSGTLGTKGHCQIIIPEMTSNYSDKEDYESEIAICTLHNFPSQIEHCIEWGKFKFGDYFNNNIKILNNLIIDFETELDHLKKTYSEIEINDKIIFINNLAENLLKDKSELFILFAIEEFNSNFNKKIQELLIKYPIDYQHKDGTRFWIGAKRPPNPIIPDLHDQNHFLFIASFCKLISSCCQNLNLKSLFSLDDLVYVKKLAATVLEEKLEKIEKDKIKNNLQNLKKLDVIDKEKLNCHIATLNRNLEKLKCLIDKQFKENPDDKQNIYNTNGINGKLKNNINSKIIKRNSLKNIKNNLSNNIDGDNTNGNFNYYDIFIPLDFEKDNDFNQHVNFIRACANSRAQNYKIKECDFIKTKLIAGRIIPAIASTTASITGFAAAQLYSICYDLNNINLETVKNAFINLGIADIIFTEPFPNQIYKKNYRKGKTNYAVIPESWSVWDYIEIYGLDTAKEFYEYFKDKFSIKLKRIIYNTKLLFEYNVLDYLNSNGIDDSLIYKGIRLNVIDGDYLKNKLDKYIILELSATLANEEKVHMPLIKYYFS